MLYLFMAKCHVHIRKAYFVTWPTGAAAWDTIHSELVRQARPSPETTAGNRPGGQSCWVLGRAFPSGCTEGAPSCTLRGARPLRLAFHSKSWGYSRRQIFHLPCLYTPNPQSLVPLTLPLPVNPYLLPTFRSGFNCGQHSPPVKTG